MATPTFHRQEESVLAACRPFPHWGGVSQGRLPGGFLNSASSVPFQAISISKAINTQEAPVKEKHARRILPCAWRALCPSGSPGEAGRVWGGRGPAGAVSDHGFGGEQLGAADDPGSSVRSTLPETGGPVKPVLWWPWASQAFHHLWS